MDTKTLLVSKWAPRSKGVPDIGILYEFRWSYLQECSDEEEGQSEGESSEEEGEYKVEGILQKRRHAGGARVPLF